MNNKVMTYEELEKQLINLYKDNKDRIIKFDIKLKNTTSFFISNDNKKELKKTRTIITKIE